jgi:ribosomal protein S18 acetylase RimI-like enzyme
VADIAVRPLETEDHERWADLFRGYRDFYGLAADDTVGVRVWGWLQDDANPVRGLVATVDGVVQGFAHVRRFHRPSSGTEGLYLDDLFTAPDARGLGVAGALLDELARTAQREDLSVIRWITREDNVTARRLYDRVAEATPWVTYDLVPLPPLR